MLRDPLFVEARMEQVDAALRAAHVLTRAQADFEEAQHPADVRDRFGLMNLHSLISTARDGMHLGHIRQDHDAVFASNRLAFTTFETLEEARAMAGVNAIVAYTRDGLWTHVPVHARDADDPHR